MIDLDKLDEQLELALTEEVRLLRGSPPLRPLATPPAPAAPATPPATGRTPPAKPAAALAAKAAATTTRATATRPAGAPSPTATDGQDRAATIRALVTAGRLGEADQQIAAQSLLARCRGGAEDQRDAALWAAMRALLDGRKANARAALDRLAADDGDEAWLQRFWIAQEWGTDDEQSRALDHCRERAYRHGDQAWRSALVVQLARMGRTDEAARELTAGVDSLGASATGAADPDVVTNLAEAAFLLGDASATRLQRFGASLGGPLVVVGRAVVCKGATARYQAHLASAAGAWAEADRAFAAAVELHRRCGAAPLLARTLREWGSVLAGRDDAYARQCLEESDALARRLQLSGFASLVAG